MENVVPIRIQIIAITVSVLFILFIARLILRGKLREEYAIIWVISTLILLTFAIWRNGLDIIANELGVYEAPNLVFTGAIFSILVYLLHLSVTVSKLHDKNKKMAQDMALLKKKMEELESDKDKQD